MTAPFCPIFIKLHEVKAIGRRYCLFWCLSCLETSVTSIIFESTTSVFPFKNRMLLAHPGQNLPNQLVEMEIISCGQRPFGIVNAHYLHLDI